MRRDDRVSEQDHREPVRALEINLISAQNLKPPSPNLRRMQTYALVWVNPDHKVRTRTDRVGCENPTWNDKFFFKVSPEFLSSETSAVCIEIYAVGYLRDHLIGTVRFLTGNFPSAVSTGSRIPTFTAVQIRRPSGRFQGVLNIGAEVIFDSEFPALEGRSAIGYREQVEENERHRRWRENRRESWSNGDGENSCPGSGDHSDGGDSTTSSSSSASNVLKDWNGIRELAGTKGLKASNGAGLLCGLLMQRKFCYSPKDEPRCFGSIPGEGKVRKVRDSF
ncbi:hypothetical protein I3843_02G029800 [Carya illinoinensis]|uniref:C2 domain-containing protein n=1 Tax=Carya illinoinensis TaxID=32201 RepID=A0A922FT09_CARIL|nr:hypothetical protein I3842_02G037300 [Carya illinoinensis]KAG7990516.1 hypothetical protein I3843_02G029800 [Carya illinoinensis]